ncbi:hypothetical protein EX30DRAFT_366665 [Ascodesmis nigricans]|uniref:NACHT-NTPase and P-loop NTPases N-terminal domain-containing protein n=1 Tax=Ascodesmis nigricans TaxID=341454 RepID=A0A4S2MKQ1_9PEZI|nr:hypothetical protein EX30DRAFT_366665 [Ascodesmis nigricans]
MADPLAVPAGVVGIVSFGINVLNGLITYYQDVKDQDDKIRAVNTQLRRLHQNFTDIKPRIEESKDTSPHVKRDDIESTLKECYAEMKELEKKLQAIQTPDPPKDRWAKMKGRFKRLRYPLDGKRTVQEIQDIASFRH